MVANRPPATIPASPSSAGHVTNGVALQVEPDFGPPDYDVAGAILCLAGLAVIMYAPR